MVVTTAVYAALLTAVFVLLSRNVIVYRRRQRIAIGAEGDPDLLRRVRAQGNFAEYVPLAIILIAFTEIQGLAPLLVHTLVWWIRDTSHYSRHRTVQDPGGFSFSSHRDGAHLRRLGSRRHRQSDPCGTRLARRGLKGPSNLRGTLAMVLAMRDAVDKSAHPMLKGISFEESE